MFIHRYVCVPKVSIWQKWQIIFDPDLYIFLLKHVYYYEKNPYVFSEYMLIPGDTLTNHSGLPRAQRVTIHQTAVHVSVHTMQKNSTASDSGQVTYWLWTSSYC